MNVCRSRSRNYLILAEVVRQVGNHDLGLGGNAILRGTTVLGSTRTLGALGVGVFVDGQRFVGGLRKRLNLAWDIGWPVDGIRLVVLGVACATTSAATASAATTATTTAGTALRLLGLLGLVLLLRLIRLAGKLDRDLAFKNGLAVELSDGAISFGGSGNIDESVANGTSGARVGRDGGAFAVMDVRRCRGSRRAHGIRTPSSP